MLGNCEICHCYWTLEPHHMLPGSNRKHCDEDGLIIWICRNCHNYLHSNEQALLVWKKEAERRYLKEHTLDEWFKRYTKNYLEPEEIEEIEIQKVRDDLLTRSF